jgi:hypothetical protein
MDAFEEVFMSTVWANFAALAAGNEATTTMLEAHMPCISIWQAKCLLVRALGVSIPQRHLLQLLQARTDSRSQQATKELPKTEAARVPHKPKAPQLIPLYNIPTESYPSAATAAPTPAEAAGTAPNHPHQFLSISEAPAGYLNREQFAVLLAAVQEERGVPFSTIASSIYRNLEATHRGYVDSTSLTNAARKGRKCGPCVLSRMPEFFAACDDIGIGKISTTQVATLLQEGAAVLMGSAASE